MLKNLAFTLSLYSGQMCTTTQDIFVPAGGIDTDEGHKSFDQVAADLGVAVDKFLSDPAVATAVLGAIQSPDTLKRIEEAPQLADVVLASRRIDHPEFPAANVRTPVLLKADAEPRVGLPAGALRSDQLRRQGARLRWRRSRCRSAS